MSDGNDIKQALDQAPEYRPQPIDLNAAKLSQRDALLDVADAGTVWRTPEGETFATVPVAGHVEHHAVRSQNFRDWMLSTLACQYEQNGRPASANGNTIRDVLIAIEARAYTEARHKAALRVVKHGDSIFIDLGGANWEAVEVQRTGWRIVPCAPVPIIRARKTAPFPIPAKPGDLAPLRRILGQLSDADFVLMIAWALGALYPIGPFPILILSGEQGSGKSTLARLARRLADPTHGDLLQPPGDDRDLIAAARNNRVLAFDNISSLKPDLADALCRVSTGGELGGRALFSDHDQATFAATRPIILNGIPDLASRGDLASRSVLLRLPPLDNRKTESDIAVEIEAALAPAFGALLDALAVALATMPNVPTPKVRMADWARLVVAAEPALSWRAGTFLAALSGNAAIATGALVEGDLVASAMRAFASDNAGGWRGRMSELRAVLSETIPQETRRSGDWPGNARWFSDRLRRVAPALRAMGVNVATRETSKGTIVEIAPLAPQRHETATECFAVNGASGANGANSQASTPACLAVDTAELLERAAIVQCDGGHPREWAEGLALLTTMPPAEGYTAGAWAALVDDAARFLDRHGATAAQLGWSVLDCFGIDPERPATGDAAAGLVPMLRGEWAVDAIHRDRAELVKRATGARQSFYRPTAPNGARPAWNLGPEKG